MRLNCSVVFTGQYTGTLEYISTVCFIIIINFDDSGMQSEKHLRIVNIYLHACPTVLQYTWNWIHGYRWRLCPHTTTERSQNGSVKACHTVAVRRDLKKRQHSQNKASNADQSAISSYVLHSNDGDRMTVSRDSFAWRHAHCFPANQCLLQIPFRERVLNHENVRSSPYSVKSQEVISKKDQQISQPTHLSNVCCFFVQGQQGGEGIESKPLTMYFHRSSQHCIRWRHILFWSSSILRSAWLPHIQRLFPARGSLHSRSRHRGRERRISVRDGEHSCEQGSRTTETRVLRSWRKECSSFKVGCRICIEFMKWIAENRFLLSTTSFSCGEGVCWQQEGFSWSTSKSQGENYLQSW